MISLLLLTQRFTESERLIGNVIDDDSIQAQCLAATIFYNGYAHLESHLAIPVDDPAPIPPIPYPFVDITTEISDSEWAVIRPLFLLYVEREQAIQLEASRGLGVDVFGRSTSEVSADITQYELGLPRQAFIQCFISI